MGIHRLMALLKEKCPKAIKNIDLKGLMGYTLACDASMAIYQFLIGTQGYSKGFGLSELTDNEGNLTGHLQGLFNRSIMLMENGIKPIWVFDGKPPELKRQLLEERKVKKMDAEEKLAKAEEAQDEEQVLKYAGQTVKITKTMTDDAKKLVRLLGLPCIEAPAEAEAQCTYITKYNLAYGVASEDMDCLTFGTPILVKGLNSKDEPVTIIDLKEVLNGLDVSMEQFIDICILCGCDYTGSIDNIGPTKALKFIKDYSNIEGVLEFCDSDNLNNNKKKTKYSYTLENFKYEESRKEFKNPEVLSMEEIKELIQFKSPAVEELKKFLIEEKGFAENRVLSGLKRIENSKDKAAQNRLDSYFVKKGNVTSTGKPVVSEKKKDTSIKKNKK